MKYSSSIINSFRLIFLLGLCLAAFSISAAQYTTTLTRGSYTRQFILKHEDKGSKLAKYLAQPTMTSHLTISPVGSTPPFRSLASQQEPPETIILGVLRSEDSLGFTPNFQCMVNLGGQDSLFLSGFLSLNSLGNLTQHLADQGVQNLFIPELFGWHPVTFIQVVNIQPVQSGQASPFSVSADTGAIEITVTINHVAFEMTLQIGFFGNELVMTLFSGHSVDLISTDLASVAITRFLPDSYRGKQQQDGIKVESLRDTFHRLMSKAAQSGDIRKKVTSGPE